MPYGYLTKAYLIPHTIEIQRRVPGRENLTEEEFAARCQMVDGVATRICDGLGEIPFIGANLCHKQLVDPLNENLLKSLIIRQLDLGVVF